MRDYLTRTALILGLVASVVLGAYVYWSYGDAARPGPGGSAASAAGTGRAQTGAGSAASAPGASGGNAAEPIESVFVHRATPQSISANSTYLNNRLINGNPDALLSVTQNWNPRGADGTYNDHPVGVWYDAAAKRWAVFNQDRAAMPEGAAFNVAVSGDGHAAD